MMVETLDRAPVDVETFRTAMRLLPSAVSVVTVRRGSYTNGFTATSVSSFSADPPTLLVSVNQSSSSYEFLRAASGFAVNVLSATQTNVADRFSGRHGHAGDARFEDANWYGVDNLRLADAVLTFECAVDEIIPRYSHAIVLGRIVDVRVGAVLNALLYWRGQYEPIGWTEDELTNAIGLCPETWPIRRLADTVS